MHVDNEVLKMTLSVTLKICFLINMIKFDLFEYFVSI